MTRFERLFIGLAVAYVSWCFWLMLFGVGPIADGLRHFFGAAG